MTTLPEHDPLDPKAPASPEQQPSSSNSEAEIPSLDITSSSPLPTPPGLAGISPDEGQPIHLFPEELQGRLTPLGRNPVENANPSVYGNLAGATVSDRDRLQPINLSDQGNPELSALVKDAELKARRSQGQESNPGRILPTDQAESTPVGEDGFQSIDLSPVARFSDSPAEIPAFLKALFDLKPPSPAFPDQPPPIPTEPPERLLFQSLYQYQPKVLPPPARIPHLGHLLLLALLATIGLLGAGLLTRSALHFHLFGIFTVQKAEADIHYTLGSMAALYLITFGAALLIFPLFWHKGLFAGLQWNLPAALRRFWLLMAAAAACFILALVDELLLPGPANAPIDKLFQTSTAAWLLFAFGVTVAPLFEEIVFRGFLLPALCTASDWAIERSAGKPAPPLDANGHPQWSIFAMVLAAVLTSVPFAAMHAEQTAYSLGPFLLLVAVSLVLCWARLFTRSLAASVLVHASYNFLLFSIMLLGTGGFKHLDKM